MMKIILSFSLAVILVIAFSAADPLFGGGNGQIQYPICHIPQPEPVEVSPENCRPQVCMLPAEPHCFQYSGHVIWVPEAAALAHINNHEGDGLANTETPEPGEACTTHVLTCEIIGPK